MIKQYLATSIFAYAILYGIELLVRDIIAKDVDLSHHKKENLIAFIWTLSCQALFCAAVFSWSNYNAYLFIAMMFICDAIVIWYKTNENLISWFQFQQLRLPQYVIYSILITFYYIMKLDIITLSIAYIIGCAFYTLYIMLLNKYLDIKVSSIEESREIFLGFKFLKRAFYNMKRG